ncbi:HIT family protein [Nitrosococcus wardiae]|uniref:HIT family protein n=1 Tax=Nitrosococcus wardiae TaxID=1814290 RepID=A0A4P7C5W9_9GAMM|nr:HIT family protein [Nitrosococcus wardiae]
METGCPFCSLPAIRIVHEITHVLVIRDLYPVSPGHTLIIPRRHLSYLAELSESEWADMQRALQLAKIKLDTELAPDGYNLGINDGAAAGQTVLHLHMHLIPRYKGDQKDPRGGVRWIFPGKADYWSK